jgi:hypothetical protein
MGKHYKITIGVFFVFVMLVGVFNDASFAFDDGDVQYWNTESISWKFTDDWKAKIEEEFRFGDDMQDFYYHHSDFGLSHSGLAEWLALGVHYRQVFEEKSGVWKQENRPHLNATIKFKLEGLDVSNRSRFEHRDREDADTDWRYRNKSSVTFPIKWTTFEIQPYIAHEIFIDFDAEDFTRNRLYAGLGLKLYKQLTGEIYYLWQSTKSNEDWIDYNILGTKLKVSF